MTDECITPLRQRMIEDMSLRNFGEKTQKDYIRAVKNLTIFLHRSPERIGNPKACIRGAERSHPVLVGLEGSGTSEKRPLCLFRSEEGLGKGDKPPRLAGRGALGVTAVVVRRIRGGAERLSGARVGYAMER